MISRRQLYHSHTSLGFLAKASGLASSSGLYSFQRPPAPRKVGTPLSAEIPAPVKTASEVACASHSRACSISPIVLSLQQGGGCLERNRWAGPPLRKRYSRRQSSVFGR